MVYDDGPFELVEASVLDMQAAMNAGTTTSVAITQEYLDRIAAYDTTLVDTGAGGRPLHSIISTSDVALEAAARADAVRGTDGMTSLLLGVPVTVKDNYDTTDMPTTGGCGCWDDNRTTTDATMVEGLRADGAVILAKASLDEFAFGFASEFSSFQGAGTSTLVASPYVTSRTAGGSSGGTGRPSRRTSPGSASARTRADRSASRRRTTSSSACARRSVSRAATASSRSR